MDNENRLLPTIYIVNRRRIIAVINYIYFDDRKQLEDMLTGMYYGGMVYGKSSAIVAVLNKEIISRNLTDRDARVLYADYSFRKLIS